MDRLDADAWWREAEEQMREREAAVQAVLAAGPRPLFIPGGWPTCVVDLLVHRDMHRDHAGGWRVTRFDETGEPCGHSEHESFEKAVRHTVGWRARLDEARAP